MTKEQRKIFMRRTYDMYKSHKKRSNGKARMLYSLRDMREMVEHHLDRELIGLARVWTKGLCSYCHCVIGVKDFSIDHAIPLSRIKYHGGEIRLSCLRVCCKSCNSAKGPLLHTEYADFLAWMDNNLRSQEKRWILGRLKAGGGMQFARRKKQ